MKIKSWAFILLASSINLPTAHSREAVLGGFEGWVKAIEDKQANEAAAVEKEKNEKLTLEHSEREKENQALLTEISEELARRKKNAVPYFKSVKRYNHIQKLETASLDELNQAYWNAFYRKGACVSAFKNMLNSVFSNFSPYLSGKTAQHASTVEKTFVPAQRYSEFDPRTRLNVGSVEDVFATWTGIFGIFNFSFTNGAAWDSTAALAKATFSTEESNSDCAEAKVDSNDVKEELARREQRQANQQTQKVLIHNEDHATQTEFAASHLQ